MNAAVGQLFDTLIPYIHPDGANELLRVKESVCTILRMNSSLPPLYPVQMHIDDQGKITIV